MANDRMYLRCPCGAVWCLAKHLGQWWYTTTWEKPAEYKEGIDRFLDKHSDCGSEHGGEWPTRFSIVHENDAEFDALPPTP